MMVKCEEGMRVVRCVVRALWRRSTRLCLAVPAPSAALAAGVVLATAYALFSGWGVPAQRTVIMLATVALLRLSSHAAARALKPPVSASATPPSAQPG